MVTCPNCGETWESEDLMRHEFETVLLVHCPSCHRLLGRYRLHGQSAKAATRRT